MKEIRLTGWFILMGVVSSIAGFILGIKAGAARTADLIFRMLATGEIRVEKIEKEQK